MFSGLGEDIVFFIDNSQPSDEYTVKIKASYEDAMKEISDFKINSNQSEYRVSITLN